MFILIWLSVILVSVLVIIVAISKAANDKAKRDIENAIETCDTDTLIKELIERGVIK